MTANPSIERPSTSGLRPLAAAAHVKRWADEAHMKDAPSNLLRFFDKDEYARGFLEGQIRFGLLDRYRTIEGSRRDEKEGQVSFYWNRKAPQITIDKSTAQVVGQSESDQNIHYSGCSLNPYYILCTSHPEASIPSLTQKFGRFVVRIQDPLALLERIKVAWQNHHFALDGCAFLAPVVYNKDGLLEADPYLIAPPHYSYSQKPNSFEEEREFRYLLQCSVDTKRTWEDFLTLRLPDSYARRVAQTRVGCMSADDRPALITAVTFSAGFQDTAPFTRMTRATCA